MFIAAVRTVLAYVAVSLYVTIVTPVGMGIALLIRLPGVLYVLGHGGVRLALAVVGIRYEVVGQTPIDRAAVYCANHQSNIDPPILFHALHPQMRVLYKRELDKLPLLPRAFKMGGFIPIDRQNKEAAVRSIETGARSIQAGHSFLIFPEGTRSRTESLLPFKKGGFIMAIRAQAPIVPVAIQGGRDSMRKGSWIIRPVTVRIHVGAPIETAGYTVDDRAELIAKVRAQILDLIATLQCETSASRA